MPRGLRVLIVEDEELVARLLARLLGRLGHAPAVAGRVAEAQLRLEAERYDLVLADFRLPDGDGAALTRWIKDRWPGLPVILATGLGEAVGPHAADVLLAKPYTPSCLREALAQVMTTVP